MSEDDEDDSEEWYMDGDGDLLGPGAGDSIEDPEDSSMSEGSTDSEEQADGLKDASDGENAMGGTEDGTDDPEDALGRDPGDHLDDPEDGLDDPEDDGDDLDRQIDDTDDPMDDQDDQDDRLDERTDDPEAGSGDQESGDGGGSSGDEAPEPRGPPPPQENSTELDQRAASLPRELYQGYRLLLELMSPSHHQHNRPFMDAVDSSHKELWDYDSIVKSPVWLKKIRERLLSGEYDSLKELFSDLRLMFRNCYRYNGPQHAVTRRALRLEQLMEQLIDGMEPDLRAQCTLQATEGAAALVDAAIVNRRRSARAKKREYSRCRHLRGRTTKLLLC